MPYLKYEDGHWCLCYKLYPEPPIPLPPPPEPIPEPVPPEPVPEPVPPEPEPVPPEPEPFSETSGICTTP